MGKQYFGCTVEFDNRQQLAMLCEVSEAGQAEPDAVEGGGCNHKVG